MRFPSLKYNAHRRFCYVQFKSPDQAHAATERDDELIGGELRLVAKISDPGHKAKRQGALYEGREVYVANVDWGAKERDLLEVFSKYGKIEHVRVLKSVAGKSKGTAFVVFSTKACLCLYFCQFRTSKKKLILLLGRGRCFARNEQHQVHESFASCRHCKRQSHQTTSNDYNGSSFFRLCLSSARPKW